MAMLSVNIDTDNAAFEDDAKYDELPRILRQLAGVIQAGSLLGTINLYDINGNLVGEARYLDEMHDAFTDTE